MPSTSKFNWSKVDWSKTDQQIAVCLGTTANWVGRQRYSFGHQKHVSTRFLTHHLKSRHPLYAVWKCMKRRCLDPSHEAYKNYGGRGISVCSQWLKSFPTFYDDAIKAGWKRGSILDRKDNDGNYVPENIRFTNRLVSSRNRRNALTIENAKLVRDLYKFGLTQKEIAMMFNVSQTNISFVTRHRTWKEVMTS